MRYLTSEGFKSKMLLDFRPGEQVSIQCLDHSDMESKATACRAFEKRRYKDLLEKGIGSLKVQKVGDTAVLVTLNPMENQAEYEDSLYSPTEEVDDESDFV